MSPPRSLSRLFALAGLVLATLLLAGTGRASDNGRVQLLVRFDSTPSREQVALLTATGLERSDSIPELGVDVLSVPADQKNDALALLRSTPGVAYAEVDAVVETAELLPSDPSFPQTFTVNTGGWGWYKTHTTQAWDITRGSPSVVVAVLDTGLKPQGLADLTGQVVSGWNVLNHSSDTASQAGVHGTEVAGVVGMALDNSAGNAGFCPNCRVMPVQVGSDQGANLSDIAAGITWAADHGAKVENLSWASTASSSTITNAVSYARSRGVVVVAAAGNAGCDCRTYPAATSGVVGVAGTVADDSRASYSNYGSWVKLAAPGSLISSYPTVGYVPVVGTSFASPLVAGIAGLLFSAAPNATVAQVEQALETSAVHVGFSVAYGRVD